MQAIEYDRGTKNYQGENLKRSHTAQQQGDNFNQRITNIPRPYLTHSELRKGHQFNVKNQLWLRKLIKGNVTNALCEMKYDKCNVSNTMWHMQCQNFYVTNEMWQIHAIWLLYCDKCIERNEIICAKYNMLYAMSKLQYNQQYVTNSIGQIHCNKCIVINATWQIRSGKSGTFCHF